MPLSSSGARSSFLSSVNTSHAICFHFPKLINWHLIKSQHLSCISWKASIVCKNIRFQMTLLKIKSWAWQSCLSALIQNQISLLLLSSDIRTCFFRDSAVPTKPLAAVWRPAGPVDTFGGYQTQFTPILVRPDQIISMLSVRRSGYLIEKVLFKIKISFALQILQPRKLIPNYESFWQNYSQNILALN